MSAMNLRTCPKVDTPAPPFDESPSVQAFFGVSADVVILRDVHPPHYQIIARTFEGWKGAEQVLISGCPRCDPP